MSEKSAKPLRLWGGFVDGRLAFEEPTYGQYPWGEEYRTAAVFWRKSDARCRYDDVRPVWVVEKEPSR